MTRNKGFLLLSIVVLGLLISACSSGGDGASDDVVASGKTLYTANCSSCHGPNAEGLEGKGKDLTNNQYIQDRSDDELLAYVLAGRAINDPLNTTGIEMPAKGGNPTLTTDQIRDIIAFLRTLQ